MVRSRFGLASTVSPEGKFLEHLMEFLEIIEPILKEG
jgi:hypothetical protein